MVAKIKIFDVAHGETCLIEIENSPPVIIVIDSKLRKEGDVTKNPVAEYLNGKNIKYINSLIITHLHSDHYSGVADLIEKFEIKEIILPPFLSSKSETFNEIINKYQEKIEKIIKSTNDDELLIPAFCLAKFLVFLSRNEELIMEGFGNENSFRVVGFPNELGKIYLPVARIRGQLHEVIKKGKFEIDWMSEMNDASVVLELNFDGFKMLFTGDTTTEQLEKHMAYMVKHNRGTLNLSAIKVPHHGSKHNNTEKVYEHFFGGNQSNQKYAFVSANGISHPNPEFFGLVEKYKLLPYCTKLSQTCGGSPQKKKSIIAPPIMSRLLLHYSVEEKYQTCQGDIEIILNNGVASISTATNAICPYRSPSI